ncbi:MAG TPA: radical SAM protein [Thermoanaerobaculia bacterium]|nr:radical SAM protein [Thermoanaerobaculia bacterium]
MITTPESRLALDPELCLKNDVDRAILITRPQPLSHDKGPVLRLLHPGDAVLLSLFDGDRTVQDVGRLWAELSDKPPVSADSDVEHLIDLYEGEGALVEVDERNRRTVRNYDPMDFVMPASRVNLTEPRFRKPYTISYMPTLYCPQRCVYCRARTSPRPEDDLIPLRRLQEIFAELRGLGVEVIQLTGGDPFARRDIFDVLESIFEEGMVPDIPTKLGLTYYEALRLKDMGVKLVQVSLDTTDPTILDRMVGVKGYHHRVFRMFDNLRRAGLGVLAHTVLTPMNVPTVGRLVDALGTLGNVTRLTLTPHGRSLFCHRGELALGREDRALVEQQVRDRVPLYPTMKITLDGERPPCVANRHGFAILPDGRAAVCEGLYDDPGFVMGDLRKQSVMEMWTSPRALALRTVEGEPGVAAAGACRSCRLAGAAAATH